MSHVETKVKNGIHIEIREPRLIDGEFVMHGHVVSPGDDVSGECQEVQDIANELWTDEVMKTYQDFAYKNDFTTTMGWTQEQFSAYKAEPQ